MEVEIFARSTDQLFVISCATRRCCSCSCCRIEICAPLFAAHCGCRFLLVYDRMYRISDWHGNQVSAK